MKVEDTGPAATEAVQSTDRKRPRDKDFASVLAQKIEARSKGTNQKAGGLQSGDDQALPFVPTPTATLFPAEADAQVAPAVHSDAAALQGLVQEILVVSEPAGQNRVEIQFTSKTLEGLHVQISQDRDQIAIRFSASSASVSNLLSRNVQQLSAALHSKGLQVGPIQIQIASRPVDQARSQTAQQDARRQRNEERRQQQRQSQK